MLIRGENLKAKFIVSNRFASMVLFFSRNRCSIIVLPDIPQIWRAKCKVKAL
jgi:hypothetical protein